MPTPCADCPFNSSAPGFRLRRSLQRGRWSEIKRGLMRGESFTCHKTTEETGNGTNLICAGAIKWQNQRGVSSNLQLVCERLDHLRNA